MNSEVGESNFEPYNKLVKALHLYHLKLLLCILIFPLYPRETKVASHSIILKVVFMQIRKLTQIRAILHVKTQKKWKMLKILRIFITVQMPCHECCQKIMTLTHLNHLRSPAPSHQLECHLLWRLAVHLVWLFPFFEDNSPSQAVLLTRVQRMRTCYPCCALSRTRALDFDPISALHWGELSQWEIALGVKMGDWLNGEGVNFLILSCRIARSLK